MNYAGIDVGFENLDIVIRKKGKSLKCFLHFSKPVKCFSWFTSQV